MGQETLISKLKNDLAGGRVVTITGTGVSIAACGNKDVEGYKVVTWTGLLQHGVQHCRDKGLAGMLAPHFMAKILDWSCASRCRPRSTRCGARHAW